MDGDGVPDLLFGDSCDCSSRGVAFVYEGLPSSVDNDGDGHSPAAGDCDDGDPDVPATTSVGAVLLLLILLGGCAYYVRSTKRS